MFKGDFEIKINDLNTQHNRTSIEERSPNEILELIRVKRSRINTNIDLGEEE